MFRTKDYKKPLPLNVKTLALMHIKALNQFLGFSWLLLNNIIHLIIIAYLALVDLIIN